MRKEMFNKKSQTSAEFVILTSFMIFVLLVFLIIIQNKLISTTNEKNEIEAGYVMDLVVNEIKLAESVSDSYYREFSLASNINGIEYNISIISGVGGTSEIVVKYYDKERVFFLNQYINNESTLGSGLNNITKNNGLITVKHMS
jgi:hypothetical protein